MSGRFIKRFIFDGSVFSLDEGGAMGEPGAVLFYLDNGELYHFNYVYGDAEIKTVQKMFVPLSKCCDLLQQKDPLILLKSLWYQIQISCLSKEKNFFTVKKLKEGQ